MSNLRAKPSGDAHVQRSPIKRARGGSIPMRKLAFAATALMFVALSAAAPADATAPAICIGGMGAGPVSGDLQVPVGKTCDLIGTTVTGNVTVLGSLVAVRAHISGNLSGNHAESLALIDTTVGGNLLADHTTGGPNFICGSTIDGNLTIQQSSSQSYWQIGPELDGSVGAGVVTDGVGCTGVTVGLNLVFQNNLGGGDITDNQIAGNLDCHNNTPAPTGGGNTVGGNEKGQCTGF